MDQNNQSQQKWMKILSYIPVLVIIPFFADKNTSVQFHAKQGMVITGVWVIGFIIDNFSYGLAQIVYLVVFIFSVWGVINVLQNKDVRLPVVADIADNLFKK